MNKKTAIQLCDLSILMKLFQISISNDHIALYYKQNSISRLSQTLSKILKTIDNSNTNTNSKNKSIAANNVIVMDKLQSDFMIMIEDMYNVS